MNTIIDRIAVEHHARHQRAMDLRRQPDLFARQFRLYFSLLAQTALTWQLAATRWFLKDEADRHPGALRMRSAA